MTTKALLLLSSALVCVSAISLPARAADDGSASGGGPQTIFVTAQKRSQDVQKVPLAVTPVLGQKLVDSGINDVRGIGALVPGITLGQDYIYTQIDIRGVGANNDAPALDPAVAFNIDGVYQPRDFGTYGAFFDIDRVEVLRGPQGTLYGRNATGGAINLITRKPVNEFQASGEVDAGNYSSIRTNGMLNVPLGPSLAVRGAFQQSSHDGYLSTGFNDQDSWSGRLQTLYRPSENVSILLGADFFHDDSNGAHTVLGLPYSVPDDPWHDPLTLAAATASSHVTPSSRFDASSIHAQFDWDLGGISITDIPAYKIVRARGTDPVVGVFSSSNSVDKSFSNEFRLASSDKASPLDWVAGVYYFKEDDYSNAAYFSNNPFFTFKSVTLNPDIQETSWALFGQGTYKLTAALRLTGGLRYSADNKEASGQNQFFVFGSLSSTTPDDFPSKTWYHLDWRAGVDFDVAPNSMLYANVATGNLEGGFNLGAKVGLLPNFNPEHLIAYTVGSKNCFFDGKVQINAEAFYYKYKDYIVSVYLTSGPAVGQFALFNTPAKIYGGEIETQFSITPRDNLYANIALLHGEYGNFVQTFVSTGLTNLSGKTLERSPSATIQAGYEHIFDLGNAGQVSFDVQTHFDSNYWTLFDHTPGSKQPGYAKTNLILTYRSPGRSWHIQAYGNNLENAAVIATAAPPNSSSPVAPGASYHVPWLHLEEPRTYGVRLGVDF